MSYLVSVIVPVYNVEKYLDKCIKSITNQSYRNIEIIIVNDGSTDSSGILSDEWQKKDNRIRVIHKENGGLSDARNVGIDASNGDWITFVDSDDYISENAIDEMLSVAEEGNYDIVIADAIHVFGAEEAPFYGYSVKKHYNSEEAICKLWYQKSYLPSAWGKIYRKNIWKDIRFTKGILFEDVDIMHELFFRAHDICYIDAGLYAYVHRENSITTQDFSERDLDILKICDKIIDFTYGKSKNLKNAALAYSIVGNMRIFLETYGNQKYTEINKKCNKYICCNGYKVLLNRNTRLKTICGIILFYLNKKLLVKFHSKVSRWK